MSLKTFTKKELYERINAFEYLMAMYDTMINKCKEELKLRDGKMGKKNLE